MSWPLQFIAVGGFVEDGKGNILMIKNPNPQRGWEFPGGQVEIGEDLEEAVKREILEESGIHVEVLRLVGMYSSVTPKLRIYNGESSNTTVLNIDFHCIFKSGEPRTSEESLEVRWVPEEEVLSYFTNPMAKRRMEAMLQKNSRIKYVSFSNPTWEIFKERYI